MAANDVRLVTPRERSGSLFSIVGDSFGSDEDFHLLTPEELLGIRAQIDAEFPRDEPAPNQVFVSNGPVVQEPVQVNGRILHALCIAENDDDYAAAFDYLRERGVEIV